MTSRRRLIIEAFRDRLEVIKKNGGYLTDAGQLIFLGESVMLGPDDPAAAIALVVEEDVPSSNQALGGGSGVGVEIRLPVSVHAVVKADVTAPLLRIEDVIHDIKRAVEQPDRTLGGLVGGLRRGPVRPLAREEGSTVAGASVGYEMVYSEAWGNPEA